MRRRIRRRQTCQTGVSFHALSKPKSIRAPESPFIFCLIRLRRYHDIDRTLGRTLRISCFTKLSIQINEYLNEVKGFTQLEEARRPGFLFCGRKYHGTAVAL